MIQKILTLLINKLIVDDNHYLLNRDKLTEPTQVQFSQKQNTFSEFFLDIQNLHSILNICQKKITLIADVFPEIPAPKNMVR